jgi:hypothetical protein
MVDQRRQPCPSRKKALKQQRRMPRRKNQHKPFRPTEALREELRRTMEEIEIAVAAIVRLRRWTDLEAAVSSYALMFGGADPTTILASAMLRPVAREAMTITDPDVFLAYARCVEGWIVLSHSGVPLHDAVEQVRLSVEHGGAMAIQEFESMDSSPLEVH